MYPYIGGTLSPAGTTTSYGYGNSTWKDLMTSYSGQTITYDTVGNPLQYRDGMTMTWQNGRQLAGISKSGLTTSYTYNGDGIRTGKTVNGVKTSFIVDGSTIVSQQGTAESGAYAINYLYDENGKAYGFYYNDAIYYYQFNGQGDVVSLVNHYGQLEASYSYDAWGKLLSIVDSDNNEITDANNVANLNIFRYRGYCYDTETGLYLLQSRYYDPVTGRFINADAFVQTNTNLIGTNMFAYCYNNPINSSDPSGYMAAEAAVAATNFWNPVGWIAAAVVVVEVVAIVVVASDCYEMAKESKTSGKAKASDKPSWVNKGMVDSSQSSEENARRMLDDKYGKGNWNKGPGTEYNKIKKWLSRDIGLKSFIPDNMEDRISPEELSDAFVTEYGNYMIPDYDTEGWYISFKYDGKWYFSYVKHICGI